MEHGWGVPGRTWGIAGRSWDVAEAREEKRREEKRREEKRIERERERSLDWGSCYSFSTFFYILRDAISVYRV